MAERSFLILSLSLVLGAGALQIRYGELFPPHGLARGDSRFYAWMARDFPNVVLGQRLDAYRVQRSLPSAVVYGVLRVLGRPAHSDEEVVVPFQLLNLTLLLATTVLWNGIAEAVPLSLSGRWLGFLLFFANFGCLKYLLYAPVLTDTTAVALGTLLVYGYVRSKPVLTWLALAAGAFTWPVLLLPSSPLLLFPRGALATSGERSRRFEKAAAVAAAGVGISYLLALAISLRYPVPFVSEAAEFGLVSLHSEWLSVSVLLAVGYVVVGFGLLAHPALFRMDSYLGGLSRGWAVSLCLTIVAVHASVLWFASGAASVNPADVFIRYTVAQPVLRPANQLVAHAVFFGMLPLLLLVRWPAVCRAAHRLGLGMTLFLASLVLLGLSAETRQLFHGLAALTLLAALSVEDLRFPRWAPWAFTGLALFASKFWFSMNQAGFLFRNPVAYPAQYFFMNAGPWMADEMYALQGSVALAALLVVVLAVTGSRRLNTAEQDALWPPNRVVLAFPAAAALTALALACHELPSRAWLGWKAASRASDPLSRGDLLLGWRNIAGAEARLRRPEFDVLVRINALGLRGPEHAYERHQGAGRVLLLGGSAAEAYSVREEKSLRAGLEAGLRDRGCGFVEVINAGVARYATDQQLAWFQAEGTRYRPDVVVLLFSHEDMVPSLRQASSNDDEGEEAPEPRRGARVLPSLRSVREPLYYWHESAALRLLSNFTAERLPAFQARLGRRGIVQYGAPPMELWPYGPREEASEAWERTRALLRAMADAVRGVRARLVVLYVPARFEIDPRAWKDTLARYRMSPRFWKPDRVARRLSSATTDLGLTLIDPRDALEKAQAAVGPAYFPHEGLWTEAGQAVAARQLAQALVDSPACAGKQSP